MHHYACDNDAYKKFNILIHCILLCFVSFCIYKVYIISNLLQNVYIELFLGSFLTMWDADSGRMCASISLPVPGFFK